MSKLDKVKEWIDDHDEELAAVGLGMLLGGIAVVGGLYGVALGYEMGQKEVLNKVSKYALDRAFELRP